MLTRLADVKPERPLWLRPGHIPKGKIVLIDGDPATGKSTLALDIAAHVTTGTVWPDGSAGCDPANVLLLTAEDGLADTVSPRIRAAQGDASKMFALSEVFKDGKEVAITLTDALPQMAQAVREQHIGLIVVDVLMSFLGSDTNSYKGQDIRAQVMAPLKRLCEETGCTVIALRHLNKGQGAAIYRGGGSIGVVGAARAAFLMAKDPENGEQRLFAPVKFNLGPMPRALAYRLEGNPLLGCAHVRWLGETDDTAESLNQSAYGTSEREDSDVRTFHPRLLRPQQGAHTGWLVLGCAVVQSNQRSERRVQQAASSGRQTTPKATAGKQEVRQHVVVTVAGLCGSSESGKL